jgi:predicted Zn-ribbon and HTH transcriptional regulator
MMEEGWDGGEYHRSFPPPTLILPLRGGRRFFLTQLGYKKDKMSTLRKKIIEALEKDFLDLREISKLFGIKEKEVLDHLIHIEKSVRQRGFIMEPASCQQCGFSFKKRTRLSTPGHCPLCKSEHISPPRFKINK